MRSVAGAAWAAGAKRGGKRPLALSSVHEPSYASIVESARSLGGGPLRRWNRIGVPCTSSTETRRTLPPPPLPLAAPPFLRGPSITWKGAKAKAYRHLVQKVGELKVAEKWDEILWVLHQTRRHAATLERGIDVDLQFYSTVVKALSWSNRPELVERVFSEMDTAGVAPDIHCYNAAINAYSRAGRLDRAKAVLQRIEDSGLTPTDFTYGVMMAAMAKAGSPDAVLSMLQRMRSSGVKASERCYKPAIWACASAGDMKRVARLLREMAADGICLRTDMYRVVMEAYSRAGDTVSTLAVLDEFHDAIVRRRRNSGSDGGDGGDSSAEASDDGGEEADFGIDSGSGDSHAGDRDNAVTEALCRKLMLTFVKIYRDREAAAALLQRLRAWRVPVGAQVYNLVVEAHAVAGDSDAAAQVVRDMQAGGVEPNDYSYNMVLAACAKVGDILRAREVLQLMQEAGCQPTVSTYTAAMQSCVPGARWQHALRLLFDADGVGGAARPNIHMLRVVFDILDSAGQDAEADMLYERMRGEHPAETADCGGSSEDSLGRSAPEGGVDEDSDSGCGGSFPGADLESAEGGVVAPAGDEQRASDLWHSVSPWIPGRQGREMQLGVLGTGLGKAALRHYLRMELEAAIRAAGGGATTLPAGGAAELASGCVAERGQLQRPSRQDALHLANDSGVGGGGSGIGSSGIGGSGGGDITIRTGGLGRRRHAEDTAKALLDFLWGLSPPIRVHACAGFMVGDRAHATRIILPRHAVTAWAEAAAARGGDGGLGGRPPRRPLGAAGGFRLGPAAAAAAVAGGPEASWHHARR